MREGEKGEKKRMKKRHFATCYINVVVNLTLCTGGACSVLNDQLVTLLERFGYKN